MAPDAPNVVVLDYGSGNLRSAERALVRAGAAVVVSPDLELAAEADGLVVPGVGAFAACMDGINTLVSSQGETARDVIAARLAAHRPVLGICVGMQILFEQGEEHGSRARGLGLLPGNVVRLRAERLPHMGWNTIRPAAGSELFAGAEAGTRFYFVHSYGVVADAALSRGATVTYSEHEGQAFVAAVEAGALVATQFHPEKSGDAGAALLKNWVSSLVA